MPRPPSLSAIVFPFRRLAIWLSVLVLGVAALALGVTALFVLPSLQTNLVDARLADVKKSSTTENVQIFLRAAQGNFAEAASDYGRATGFQVGLIEPNAAGTLTWFAGSVRGTADDSLAAAAWRTGAQQSGVVRLGDRYAAEVALSINATVAGSQRRYVLLFASPLDDVGRTVSTVRRAILLAVAIALPAAWVVGMLAAFALASRIRRLERAARRIAAGNLSTPVSDRGRDEIHELAVAFDEMRRRLDRTDRARREFIANASHELRTPLFALGGFLELLEEEDDPEARREFVQTMRGQVTRLTRLATDLLDLSRLDAGGVEFHREDVDLAAVAAVLVTDFAAAAEQRGSSVTLRDGEAALAVADEARVAQIGRALIDNALRHTPAGTTIEVSSSVDVDGVVTLVVSDDGPPIPDEALDRLFDRFYRGPGSGEGSGLGLAIAQGLARRMGGELVLVQGDGAPGKAFRLSLPAAATTQLTMLGT